MIVIRGGRVFDPTTRSADFRDIHIDGDTIAEIGVSVIKTFGTIEPIS
jgi:hypothetical protein